jgi:Asp23 family, cell envelope-related function
VAALARDTARLVPGVRVALGRSTHSKPAAPAEQATFGRHYPHAAVGVLGGTAVVDLAVAVTYGQPLPEMARDIQQRVIATLRDQIGLQAVVVNVTVDDIFTDDDQ